MSIDPSQLSGHLSGINAGSVMEAAARDYMKELQAAEKSKRNTQVSEEDFDLDALLDDPER